MKLTNVVLIFSINLYFIDFERKTVFASMSNFVTEKFYWCEDVPEQNFKFFLNPKDFNSGLQLMDANLTLPFFVGNDFLVKVLFEKSIELASTHSWVYLFNIDDRLCKFFDKYLGEFWYEMQRALGIMTRSCPLPRGSYHAVNFQLDYQKLKLQTFPFGKNRIRLEIVSEAHQLQLCNIFVVSIKSEI